MKNRQTTFFKLYYSYMYKYFIDIQHIANYLSINSIPCTVVEIYVITAVVPHKILSTVFISDGGSWELLWVKQFMEQNYLFIPFLLPYLLWHFQPINDHAGLRHMLMISPRATPDKVQYTLVQWFQRGSFKCECLRCMIHGQTDESKSSHDLWPDYLKTNIPRGTPSTGKLLHRMYYN